MAEKSAPVAINTILWGNAPDQIYPDASTPIDITYSCIEGGYPGADNINDDPLFVPTEDPPYDYYIAHSGPQAANSPCIDAGFGDVADYGLSGTTTSTDGSADGNDDGDSDTGPIDMGYHYPEGYTGGGDTFIDLVSFTATQRGSSIILQWQTGAEIDNAGFVLFRAIMGTQNYEQISDLMAAEGAPSSGASYSFSDSNVQLGITYNYWLADIDTSGKWTSHGPVAARLALPRTRLIWERRDRESDRAVEKVMSTD